ncbi:MAG: transposase [Deltaproteobacteria bacterium]|nr:transposase [Deltaproteobacteria bacterium]
MKRVQSQTLLPFGRRERVVNRQIAQRMSGKKVTRGPGRPKSSTRLPHVAREVLGEKTAVHVTMRCCRTAPALRTRRHFALLKRAFGKHGGQGGFRVIHFAVLGDHVHLLCEADSKQWLTRGMRALAISIARLLNVDGVRKAGGSLDPRHGEWSARRGWIGQIFAERYDAHVLATPTEIANCLTYLFDNAKNHFGQVNEARICVLRADGRKRYLVADTFTSFALLHASRAPQRDGTEELTLPNPRGFLLGRAIRQQVWATRRS